MATASNWQSCRDPRTLDPLSRRAMNANRDRATLTLSEEELFEITGYRAARLQLKVLQGKGLPAFMRPDNTVSLGRVHYKLWLIEQDRKPKKEGPQLRPIK